MKLRVFVMMLCTALFAAPACGGLSTGKVPADSELKPWEAPDEEDLIAEEDDEDEEEVEDEEEDEGEDEGESGDAADATGAAAPAPAAAATPAAPAKTKGKKAK